jgi:NIPSNAP
MAQMNRFSVLVTMFALCVGIAIGATMSPVMVGHAQASGRVFEIRTYTTHPGKLDALNARFRNHTTRIFGKHGMANVAYWVPQDAPASQNTLIYVIAHESREAAKKNWDEFRADPEWQKARTESEAPGPIVLKVDSVFANATDYSPVK